MSQKFPYQPSSFYLYLAINSTHPLLDQPSPSFSPSAHSLSSSDPAKHLAQLVFHLRPYDFLGRPAGHYCTFYLFYTMLISKSTCNSFTQVERDLVSPRAEVLHIVTLRVQKPNFFAVDEQWHNGNGRQRKFTE